MVSGGRLRDVSSENTRSKVSPPLLQLLLQGLWGEGAVDGLLGELPHVLLGQPKRGRRQLVLLGEVGAEDPLIVRLVNRRNTFG